ncbi:MAG TPA: hypothetical protein VFA95_11580 [Gammaproteobacteria bacterium]|nr:hypothetical protein [Gammaproteobacteria bacterium]
MKRHLRIALTVALGTALIAPLAGCGGGGGSSSGGASSTPTTKTIAAEGVYSGSYTMSGTSQPISVYGAILPNGYAYFGDSQGALYVLPNGIKTGSFSGTLTAYAPIGEVFANGQSQTSFSLNGKAQDNGSVVTDVSGSFSGAGESGNFTLNRQGISSNATSLPKLAGSYSGYYWGSGSAAIALTVASDGTVTGNDAYGCTITGKMSVVSGEDLVKIQADSTGSPSCVGSVSGLGFVASNDISGLFGGASGTYIYVGASNSTVGFVAELHK